jgi:hypothetical protein
VTGFRSYPESVEEFGHSSSLIALRDTLDLYRGNRDVAPALMAALIAIIGLGPDEVLNQIPYPHCDNKLPEY